MRKAPSREPSIHNIIYRCPKVLRRAAFTVSVDTIGIDTEAYTDGQCFMLCTSEGDTFKPSDFPECLFTRAYRNKTFVAYNLKYDSGAFLQFLDSEALETLRDKGTVKYKEYRIKAIGYKCLSIGRKKNTITFYDMLNFYGTSLDKAARLYLNETKLDLGSKDFTREGVLIDWDKIAAYCIKDAVLVRDLARRLIKMFEGFGVYPKKLYSVAYISYQYFRVHTPYVTVKRYWDKEREVLDYAMRSYNGGKFEVTKKGPGTYYQYDVVSAYPYEIKNLVDISYARIETGCRYRPDAVYGFLEVMVDIPEKLASPLVMKRGNVNCYPCGQFSRFITKTEYDFLVSHGADVIIKSAYWLHVDHKDYPYRAAIERLVKLKQEYKTSGKELEYHTVKILCNSLYGKFLQLIPRGSMYQAGASWNPIYGSIITANTRVKMSAIQNDHAAIVAVHTDSIISTTPIDFGKGNAIGDFAFVCSGEGVILGSGIYQIADKVKFRGFDSKIPLIELLKVGGETIPLKGIRPLTWREVAFRGLELDRINRFEDIPKDLSLHFDKKRLWLNDWTDFSQSLTRTVDSLPLFHGPLFF